MFLSSSWQPGITSSWMGHQPELEQEVGQEDDAEATPQIYPLQPRLQKAVIKQGIPQLMHLGKVSIYYSS